MLCQYGAPYTDAIHQLRHATKLTNHHAPLQRQKMEEIQIPTTRLGESQLVIKARVMSSQMFQKRMHAKLKSSLEI